MLHGRNTIRVLSDKNDSLDCSQIRVLSDIEADSHVDTFLLKAWLEVSIS